VLFWRTLLHRMVWRVQAPAMPSTLTTRPEDGARPNGVTGVQAATSSEGARTGSFLADELAVHLAGKLPGDLVFTAPGGAVLRNTNFRPRCFDPAAERARASQALSLSSSSRQAGIEGWSV
jgi:hypothetical protein